MIPLPLLPPASLSRSAVRRNHLSRGTDGDLSDVWARSGTVGVLSHRGYLLVAAGRLFTVSPADVPPGGTQIYLGIDPEGRDYIGIDLDDEGRTAVDQRLARDRDRDAEDFLDSPSGIHVTEPTWLGLRQIATELNDVDAGLACALVAVGNWHRTHTHSPRNGSPTEVVNGGWVRRDPGTGSEHFPRTDPAVIMAVVHTSPDGTERILLGNNAQWPEGRYSLLAGFVEPGETLEAAVIREVWEEAGVLCESPAYMGSQPWPFPSSLMLGFTAEATSLDLRPDGAELFAARWFTRQELLAEIEAGSVAVPGEVSIAGQILSSWLTAGS
ncbi:NAD(+) diphosphatase [Brevibacterium daeguense]|uniref:NAD(+) diphosphatase n=1 Tax=Brevibacterium daeguense TaxID=909936 RepID=UPI001F01E86D|nr:NAD(+) diphosphatase [Brevibacterium daeguense]